MGRYGTQADEDRANAETQRHTRIIKEGNAAHKEHLTNLITTAIETGQASLDLSVSKAGELQPGDALTISEAIRHNTGSQINKIILNGQPERLKDALETHLGHARETSGIQVSHSRLDSNHRPELLRR